MEIQNILDTFNTFDTLSPIPQTHTHAPISIQQSPQAHHLDSFDTFDTTFMSVKRSYNIGNSDYLGHF